MLWSFVRLKRRRSERGYTLIEVFIVLAILGILLAMVLPRYIGARRRPYKAEAETLLGELKTLSYAFYQEYSSFPTLLTQIGYLHPSGSAWTTPANVAGTTVSVQWSVVGNGTKAVTATDICSVSLLDTGSSGQGCSF